MSLSKKPFGLFRQSFAVCCTHIVEAQKTMFHIPCGIFHLFSDFSSPHKAHSALWGPLLKACKFHTCSLRSVFVHVHAAAENGFYFVRRRRDELCEAFEASTSRYGKNFVPACFILYYIGRYRVFFLRRFFLQDFMHRFSHCLLLLFCFHRSYLYRLVNIHSSIFL